jgi:hypothetical protein
MRYKLIGGPLAGHIRDINSSLLGRPFLEFRPVVDKGNFVLCNDGTDFSLQMESFGFVYEKRALRLQGNDGYDLETLYVHEDLWSEMQIFRELIRGYEND